jgi:hypothetical protein
VRGSNVLVLSKAAALEAFSLYVGHLFDPAYAEVPTVSDVSFDMLTGAFRVTLTGDVSPQNGVTRSSDAEPIAVATEDRHVRPSKK